jgi:hypothetical protein
MGGEFGKFPAQLHLTPRRIKASGQIGGLRLRPGGQERHGLGYGGVVVNMGETRLHARHQDFELRVGNSG